MDRRWNREEPGLSHGRTEQQLQAKSKLPLLIGAAFGARQACVWMKAHLFQRRWRSPLAAI